MNVKILKPGRYLNEQLKAVSCKAGFVLATKDWYGKDLIKSGFAQEIPVPVKKPAPKEVAKPKTTKEKGSKKRNEPVVNPFVEL